MNGMSCYITQLVMPTADISMELCHETTDCYDALGCNVMSIVSGYSLTTNISFQAVHAPNCKNLVTIEMEG